jgi:hypothetical protein
MSYQQNSRITQFVPSYVPHSDFLNTRVLEVSESDRIQMVYYIIYLVTRFIRG